MRVTGHGLRVAGYELRSACWGSFDLGFRIRDMGLTILIGWLLRCRLRVAGRKEHRACGIAHRERNRLMESTGGSTE